MIADADVVVPVPLHWRRFFWRRFNQSAELARAIAGLSAAALRAAWRPAREGHAPAGRAAASRTRGQCARRLHVPPSRTSRCGAGGCWLSTMSTRPARRSRQWRKALKKSGAEAVDVLTFARVLPGDFRPDDQDLYRLGRQADGKPPMVDVTIYTRMMCGYCAAAKRLLDGKGVAYTEHDASFSPELRQEMMSRANGRTTFPADFHRRRPCRRFRRSACAGAAGQARRAACKRTIRAEGSIMSIFKAAAIQMRSGTEPRRNAADFEALVREAAGQGRDLCPDARNDRRDRARQGCAGAAFTTEERDEIALAASGFPPNSASILHVGSTAILRPDGKLANRALLFAPDGAHRSPATTRSTCSTSISTMAKAGANRRPMSPAPRRSSPTSAWRSSASPSATICASRSSSAPRRWPAPMC